MDNLPEDLLTNIKIILADENLTEDQKIIRLRSLDLDDEILDEINRKMRGEVTDWLTTDNSLSLVPLSYADLSVPSSSEESFEYQLKHNSSQEDTTEKGKTTISDETSSAREGDPPPQKVKIRKYRNPDYVYETPLNEPINRRILSEAFGELDQVCHIFFYYNFLCTLALEDSLFKPEKDGDFIIAFEKDVKEISSLQRLISALMVDDGLEKDIKSHLTSRILDSLGDDEKDNVKNVFIKFKRWDMFRKWAINKDELIQSLVVGLIEEFKGVQLNTSFESQASSPFCLAATDLDTTASESAPALIGRTSLVPIPDTNVQIVDLSPKETFLSRLSEGLKEVVLAMINNKFWKQLEAFMEDNNDANIKEAYSFFISDHRNNHPDEFLEENSENLRNPEARENEEIVRSDDDYDDDSPVIPNVDLDLEEPMTIVVSGETGAGKSTFINSLANYLIFKKMLEAEKPTILMPIKFEFQDKNLERFHVSCKPTIPIEDEDFANEYHEGASSCTQRAKAYLFRFGPEERQTLRIIDTPGVADVRGLSQDKENFDRTLRYISKYKTIDAILFVLKPNEANLSTESKYCIQQLLTHLNKSAAKNILFCFTNTQLTDFKPGDTLHALQQYLAEFNAKRGVSIVSDDDTNFCFDSEAFRYLCARKNGCKFSDESIQDFNQSWIVSQKEALRLIAKIKTLEPHRTRETLSVNNIRSIVFMYSEPMARLNRSFTENVEQLKENMARVMALTSNLAELQSKPLMITLTRPVRVELPKPVTVCTNEEKPCISIKRYVSPHLTNYGWTCYNTTCHNPCYLTVQLEKVPNSELKRCHAFKLHGIDKCMNCECPWDKHMHIKYRIEEEEVTVENEDLSNKLQMCTSELDAKQTIVAELQRKKEEIEREATLLKKTMIDCTVFLEKHACSTYNDVFRQTVVQLIREEKHKVEVLGIPNTVLLQMEKDLAEHDAQVALFRSLPSENRQLKSLEEIEVAIEELKNLPLCAELLANIEEYEWMHIEAEQNNHETFVSLQNGFLSANNCRH